jgi:hypothetical protein
VVGWFSAVAFLACGLGHGAAFVSLGERMPAGEQQAAGDVDEREQRDARTGSAPAAGTPVTNGPARTAATTAPTNKHGRATIGEASIIRAGVPCWIRVTMSARTVSPPRTRPVVPWVRECQVMPIVVAAP